MSAGAGFYDANGVWKYGETDSIALFSDTLNKGMTSVSSAISADRTRLTTLETSPTASGTSTSARTRLTATDEATLSSTLHPFQIGPTSGGNLRIDSNEVQAVNNGVATTVNINPEGGSVIVGQQGAEAMTISSGSNVLYFNTSGAERVRLDSTGNFFVGKTSTTSWQSTPGLYSQQTGATTIAATGASPLNISRGPNSATAAAAVTFYNYTTTSVGSITVTSSATAYVTSSDYRLKENFQPLSDSVERLKQLQPKRFNFTAEPETVIDGFVAHEVQEIIPNAVVGVKDEVDENGDPVYQGIDHSKLVPILTAALQEAIARIEVLEAKCLSN